MNTNVTTVAQLLDMGEVYYVSSSRFGGETKYKKAKVVRKTERRTYLEVEAGDGVREVAFGSDQYGYLTRELKTATNERPSDRSYLITVAEGERRIANDEMEKQHQAIVAQTKAAVNDVKNSLSIQTAQAAIEQLQVFIASRQAL